MAGTYLLLCLILCVGITEVHAQTVYHVVHVSEEGRSVTALCPPHKEQAYTIRQWTLYKTLLRPASVIYQQNSGGAVNAIGARPDMSLNLTDWSLTIGSLQVEDTGLLNCQVYIGGLLLHAVTYVVVYNRWVDVRYGTSVTLQCPVAPTYSTRQWYTWPISASPYIIYTQTSSGVTQGGAARTDMSLDTASFNLTIGNMGWNDYICTCHVTTPGITSTSITFLGISSRVALETEENTSVTLLCDDLNSLSTTYYTRTWQKVNGDVLYQQTLYKGVFSERRPAARTDMSLNNETFILTIRSAQLEDDTMFVCIFGHLVGDRNFVSVRSVRHLIYINPRILFSGLDDTPVSVGTTVTVTCTIDRVYPELGPDDFQMRWGAQVTSTPTWSQNGDKSYSYTLQYTHTVDEGDNGTVVECYVIPRKGQAAHTTKTLIVYVPNQNPSTQPPITGVVSPSVTRPTSPPVVTDGALPLVTRGVSLPVLGGAVAGAAVLITLIIVIVVCVYNRRKARVNTVTNQARRAGDSRRGHKLDVPVSSHDETYLPGAVYHDYEEIPAQGHVPTASGPYEKLQTRLNANTPIAKWFKDKGISSSIVKKLKRQKISTIQDLQQMSREDMVEAGLKVGERNRIKQVLGASATTQF